MSGSSGSADSLRARSQYVAAARSRRLAPRAGPAPRAGRLRPARPPGRAGPPGTGQPAEDRPAHPDPAGAARPGQATGAGRGRWPGWMRARPGSPAGSSPIRLPGRLAGRRDVLVDVEHVVRVVALLDLGEPVVVAAVCRPDPVLALAHQEVDVAASRR